MILIYLIFEMQEQQTYQFQYNNTRFIRNRMIRQQKIYHGVLLRTQLIHGYIPNSLLLENTHKPLFFSAHFIILYDIHTQSQKIIHRNIKQSAIFLVASITTNTLQVFYAYLTKIKNKYALLLLDQYTLEIEQWNLDIIENDQQITELIFLNTGRAVVFLSKISHGNQTQFIITTLHFDLGQTKRFYFSNQVQQIPISILTRYNLFAQNTFTIITEKAIYMCSQKNINPDYKPQRTQHKMVIDQYILSAKSLQKCDAIIIYTNKNRVMYSHTQGNLFIPIPYQFPSKIILIISSCNLLVTVCSSPFTLHIFTFNQQLVPSFIRTVNLYSQFIESINSGRISNNAKGLLFEICFKQKSGTMVQQVKKLVDTEFRIHRMQEVQDNQFGNSIQGVVPVHISLQDVKFEEYIVHEALSLVQTAFIQGKVVQMVVMPSLGYLFLLFTSHMHIYQLQQFSVVLTCTLPNPIYLSAHPYLPQLLIVYKQSYKYYYYYLDSGQIRNTGQGNNGEYGYCKYSYNGQWVAISGTRNLIIQKTTQKYYKKQICHQKVILIEWYANSTLILTLSSIGSILITNIHTLETIFQIYPKLKPKSVSYDPAVKIFAILDKTVKLWCKNKQYQFIGLVDISCMLICKQLQIIVLGMENGEVRIYSWPLSDYAVTSQDYFSIKVSISPITALTFTPSLSHLLVFSQSLIILSVHHYCQGFPSFGELVRSFSNTLNRVYYPLSKFKYVSRNDMKDIQQKIESLNDKAKTKCRETAQEAEQSKEDFGEVYKNNQFQFKNRFFKIQEEFIQKREFQSDQFYKLIQSFQSLKNTYLLYIQNLRKSNFSELLHQYNSYDLLSKKKIQLKLNQQKQLKELRQRFQNQNGRLNQQYNTAIQAQQQVCRQRKQQLKKEKKVYKGFCVQIDLQNNLNKKDILQKIKMKLDQQTEKHQLLYSSISKYNSQKKRMLMRQKWLSYSLKELQTDRSFKMDQHAYLSSQCARFGKLLKEKQRTIQNYQKLSKDIFESDLATNTQKFVRMGVLEDLEEQRQPLLQHYSEIQKEKQRVQVSLTLQWDRRKNLKTWQESLNSQKKGVKKKRKQLQQRLIQLRIQFNRKKGDIAQILSYQPTQWKQLFKRFPNRAQRIQHKTYDLESSREFHNNIFQHHKRVEQKIKGSKNKQKQLALKQNTIFLKEVNNLKHQNHCLKIKVLFIYKKQQLKIQLMKIVQNGNFPKKQMFTTKKLIESVQPKSVLDQISKVCLAMAKTNTTKLPFQIYEQQKQKQSKNQSTRTTSEPFLSISSVRKKLRQVNSPSKASMCSSTFNFNIGSKSNRGYRTFLVNSNVSETQKNKTRQKQLEGALNVRNLECKLRKLRSVK